MCDIGTYKTTQPHTRIMANETPTPPESLPKYLAEGMDKQDDDTLHDVIAFAEELIEHRAQAEPEIPDNAEIVKENTDKGGSVVEEMVVCGKDGCRCADGDLHGPYLYRYWSENGETQKEYIGKAD